MQFDVLGYIEQGTTTTPWSMLRLNNVSRFTVVDIAAQRVATSQPNHPIGVKAHVLGSYWKHQLVEHEKYTIEHGEDPAWCNELPELGDKAI
jgi:xylulose-5-phosphate/fructose-6-phosphate phosphoketolase